MKKVSYCLDSPVIFICIRKCDGESFNCACFSTEKEASEFCSYWKSLMPLMDFCFEEWHFGEITID